MITLKLLVFDSNLGEKAKEIFSNYINANFISKQYTLKTYDKMEKIFIEQKRYFKKINYYVEKNRNNKLIPKREVMKWLRRNNQSQALKWLHEDGKIRHRTIFRIQEPNFVKSMVPSFNKVFSQIYIKIENTIFEPSPGYVMINYMNSRIKLFGEYQKIALKFGGLVTKEEPSNYISLKELLEVSSIYDEESLAAALDEIEYLTTTKLRFMEPFYEFDEVVIYDKISKEFLIVKISEIVNNLIDYIFRIKKANDKEIADYILSTSKRRYDYERIKEIIELRMKA